MKRNLSLSPPTYCSQTNATIQDSLVRYIPSITGTSNAVPLLTLDGWLKNTSPVIGMCASSNLAFDIHGQARPTSPTLGQKYWQLESDDRKKKHEAPHWRDVNRDGDADDTHLGERNLAVAFTRNTAPSISAKFHIPNSAGCAVKLRATGTGGINFPETIANLEGENSTASAAASAAFPNTVKHYDKDGSSAFTLDWEYQLDGSTSLAAPRPNKTHCLYHPR